ncbi:MAG: DsbA family protein [Sandaracinaceae bacterium]
MVEIEFEYWSDPLCVWAFVSQPKLEHVLSAHSGHVAPRYRIVPVFGSLPARFRDGAWTKVGPKGRAEATRRVAHAHGRPEVTGQFLLDDPPASSWASGAAARAVIGMSESGEGDSDWGADYVIALRQACFVDNLNIARRHHQLAVAESLHIPRAPIERRLDDGTALAELYEDHKRRLEIGIQGSPTFVFDGGRAMLYGNVAEDVLTATVDQIVAGQMAGGSTC